MMRKFSFASAAVLLQPKGVVLQANAGVLILVIALVLQLSFRPYVNHGGLDLNRLEATSLLTAFATLNFGVFSGCLDTFREINHIFFNLSFCCAVFLPGTSSGWQTAFTCLLVALNFGYLAYAASFLFRATKALREDAAVFAGKLSPRNLTLRGKLPVCFYPT